MLKTLVEKYRELANVLEKIGEALQDLNRRVCSLEADRRTKYGGKVHRDDCALVQDPSRGAECNCAELDLTNQTKGTA